MFAQKIFFSFVLTAILAFQFSTSNAQIKIPFPDDRRDSYDNSAFVSQYVPDRMSAGESYRISVTMRNTGNTTWTTSFLDIFTGSYALSPVNRDSYGWNMSPVKINLDVRPGENHTFDFMVTAPGNDGTYDFQWRMTNGNSYFGENTRNIRIRVDRGFISDDRDRRYDDRYFGNDNASFINHTIPSIMKSNRAYPVTVTMLNSGNSTWEKGYYTLEPVSSVTSASDYKYKKIKMNKTVRPGEQVQVKFNIKAPSQSGIYHFQWRMMNGQSGFFGESTPLFRVEVNRNPRGDDSNYNYRDYDDDDDDDKKDKKDKKQKKNNKNKSKR
jgi:hypothetical protein